MPIRRKNNTNSQGKKSAIPNTNQKTQGNQASKAGSKNQPPPSQPSITNKTVGQVPGANSPSQAQAIPASLVTILFTILFIWIIGAIFNAFQLLPNAFVQIAGGLSTAIAFIMLFWQIGGKDLLIQVWQTFWLRSPMWICIGVALLFSGSIFLFNFIPYYIYVTSPKATPYIYDDPTPTIPIPILSLSLPNVKWTQSLYQEAPDCNNKNANWYEYLGRSFLSCNGHNLVMQYESATNEPEVYLETIGGKPYDQTNFRVTTYISFGDLGRTSTQAQIAVQTSQPSTYSGGYIFALEPTGKWYLCNGTCNNYTSIIDSGRIYDDMTRPIEMTIEVYKGHLFGLINQKKVISIGETSSSSARYIGLRIGNDSFVGSPNSSTVIFSNFELDIPT